MIKTFKRIVPVIVLMALSFTAFSQTVKFRKVIGNSGYDYGYSAKQTFDKGYIIGGTTSTFGSGNTDMYVVKTDSMGIPYRHAMIGGINIDQGSCLRQTSDSGYVFLGYTNSYGAGGYDLYLVKMDSTFNIQWTKTYGGTDWDFGYCVEPTPIDGGYILCGSTYSFGNGDKDYYLIKTNALGDTLWTKTYGGSKEDEAKSVVPTSDGGYILTGTTKSMGDTLGDFYTIKTDSFGDTTWTNRFGSSTRLDYSNDILESMYGGYILCGESQTFSAIGNSDGIVVKIAPSGATIGMMYQTYLTTFDTFKSITEDTTGRIAMVGDVGSVNIEVMFSMLRNDFSWINATTFGALKYDGGFSIEPTADSGFVICGTTKSFNNFLNDIYLIKTDTLGYATTIDNLFFTGIENEYVSNNVEFEIYPNPANTIVMINVSDELVKENLEILIVDVLGKEMNRFEVNNSTISINTTDVSDGVYFVTLKNQKFISTQKFVVRH